MTMQKNDNKPCHLLIVDDDQEIRDLLGRLLQDYGYEVTLAQGGEEMFSVLAEQQIDLVILDLMMPGEDGLSLCRRLRTESNTPVIMLTAIGEETDKIVGLEMGADDYVSKPFNPRELVARIKAVLRRSAESPAAANLAVNTATDPNVDPSTVYFADWTLVMSTRCLSSPDGVDISLSAGEYDLLEAFIQHPQTVLNRDQLLDYTRNRVAGPFDRSIDVQVSRLRQKIEVDPKKPELIKTIRGGGYLFTPRVVRASGRAKR